MKLMLPLLSRTHHLISSRRSIPCPRASSATSSMLNRSERRFCSTDSHQYFPVPGSGVRPDGVLDPQGDDRLDKGRLALRVMGVPSGLDE